MTNKPIVHCVSISGGKDSQATGLLALETIGWSVPDGEIKFFFADTGNEHELTYAHVDYLEGVFGAKIERVRRDFTKDLERHRDRLLRIADGAPDYYPAAQYPWTAERARRAAALVWPPTGNPFLDLCLLRGAFPSRTRQFCTAELKRDPLVERQLEVVDSGSVVWSWQGVRRDESARRANLEEFEVQGGGVFVYRPIVRWRVEDVIEASRIAGVELNPLYRMGMNRVGCMPCINSAKAEIRQIAERFPQHIERIREWESIVEPASRSGSSAFFPWRVKSDGSSGRDNRGVLQVVAWSKTTRGGRQLDLLAADGDLSGCSSAYGLCESG